MIKVDHQTVLSGSAGSWYVDARSVSHHCAHKPIPMAFTSGHSLDGGHDVGLRFVLNHCHSKAEIAQELQALAVSLTGTASFHLCFVVRLPSR